MAISRSGGGANVAAQSATFPLSVHATGRYLINANGTPFLIHGDTGWSAVGMLTDVQIDQYVDDRYAKGFNLILIEAPVFEYTTDGSAGEENIDGVAPFTTMSPHYDWVLNDTYWLRVDRLVDRCKARGMAVIINPAYMGYNGDGVDGCMLEITNASAGTLQTYGAALATRYAQENVIWSMGGDWHSDSTGRTKQWNIVTGMRTVRTTDIITAHPESDVSTADYWNGMTGYNLGMTYCYETSAVYGWDQAATEYARSPVRPFIGFEFKYENSVSATTAMLRRQTYGALLSGACGQIYGNLPIWNFESPQWGGESWTGTWQSHLNDTGCLEQAYAKALMLAYSWWLLVPKTDASLVSSLLGSTTTRLFPALASDSTFALIYVPSSQTVTVVMTNFASSSVRVRLYDPTNGTYSTVGTYANTGSQSIATGGERVIVLDAG